MRILPVFIPHAGCPHTCIYCDQNQASGQDRLPGVDGVVALIGEALRSGPLDQVAFYGGTFTMLPEKIRKSYLETVRPYLARGEIGDIRVSTRPDAIDVDTVESLRQAGVGTVEIGAQSFSDRVLRASRRGYTSVDIERACRLLKRSGAVVGVQLMPGLPADSPEDSIASVRSALSLNPDFLRIYPTVVFAGTGLETLFKSGHYRPCDLDDAVDHCADIELLCRKTHVRVVRYGLQANERLDAGAIVAGPYHPAFGQLVRARIWRRGLQKLQRRGVESVAVHPSELSDAIGHHRDNLSILNRCGRRFAVRPESGVRCGHLRAGTRDLSVARLAAGKEVQ